jgi:propanol-preferring alcohol dehydrogenase
VGDSTATPPVSLDAALIFAPVGSFVIQARKAIRKDGVVVCGGILRSDIPSFPYSLLSEKRSIRSVEILPITMGRNFSLLPRKYQFKQKSGFFPWNR